MAGACLNIQQGFRNNGIMNEGCWPGQPGCSEKYAGSCQQRITMLLIIFFLIPDPGVVSELSNFNVLYFG